MSDLLKAGSAWLQSQRTAFVASEVSYTRDGTTVTVLATSAKTEYKVDTGEGLVTRLRVQDYLINAVDLDMAFGVAMYGPGYTTNPNDLTFANPEPGDRITDTNGAQQAVYEVMSPGASEPAWRYSDNWQQTFRIHTKFVALANQ